MTNRCPKCGHTNPDGVPVCAQCASPLMQPCINCGFENPANFKFCGNCGAKLDAASAQTPALEPRSHIAAPIPDALAQKISSVGKQLEGERRNVTVLFSDISGFTTIAEKLDPEQVYEFIDSTLKAFTDEIYKHEGTLDKVLGDGVMALFGAPIAHEDDPARAVRAALGMQDALKRINADLEPRLGISLRVRIGLHTGTVVVGRIGSDLRMEYTALGDTVNVASRLQSAAEPGTILVSRAVYEPTKPLFEFRELGAIRVKNRVEPVEIFEAVAPRQSAGRVRGVPGLSAPMVGRAEEFARVRGVVDDLMTNRRGRIVLVTGNAGIGKSRLTSELKGYLANKWVTVLEGACLAYGQPAYGVFLQILKTLLGIGDNDTEEIVREKIERVAQDLLSAEEFPQVVPYLEHLLSIRIFEKEMATRIRHLTPAQLQQQTFIAIRELLTALAQGKPLVLILEDVHWLDNLSLDLLMFLLGSVETVPLLIYCNSRPDEGAAAAKLEKLGNDMYPAHFLRVPLTPLSHADSVALIDLLLTIHELPERLRHLIPQRAEGNPFYLEEIIRRLIDRGVIRRGAARWEMTPGADVDNLQVPTTLQGLIMTRVDHLNESARQTIQCASVIGRDFARRLLEHVVEGARDVREIVQELEERQLVSCISINGDAHYRFNHVLIQETVYHSLLMRRREYLHHKIGASIETLYQDRLDGHIEELAFHFAESKDLDRALPYAIRAGKHAAERFANEQALRHYQRAAEFLTRIQPTTEQKIDAYTGLGSVQTFTGDYSGATTSYLIALEVVRSSGKTLEQTRQCAEIMRSIGRVGERKGDYAEALRWLENALKELEADPDLRSAERVRIYNDIGWVQYRRGEFDQAYDWRMRALQIVEGTEYYNEMASAYNGLVALFGRKGDWERANAYAEKGLKLRERIGDLQGISQSYTSMAVSEWEQGDWARAREHLERSLDIKQKIGDIEGIARLNSNLSELNRGIGEYARALELGEHALRGAEKIKNNNLISFALINLAHVLILQGKLEDAQTHLTRCLTIATEMGSKERIAEARLLLAQVHLERDQLEPARQIAEQALALATEIGRRLIEGQVLRLLAQLAQRQNDRTAATDYLERSIAVLSASKNQFELAKSQHQLGLLHRDAGRDVDARALLENALNTFTQLGAQVDGARVRAELEQLTPSSGNHK
ncbi:MAG: tetratricopeptide repeat protein [Anaerolineales bacterium]|nr:tetratricopeptide repeat protein [Anaerolineales bacterium]